MNKLLVLSLLLLSACGKMQSPQDPRTIHGVDTEFIPYVDLYIQSKGYGLGYSIPIGFTDLPDDTVGLCTRWSNGYRQIQVDRAYWDYISENEKRSLIFHELGHCDLNRNHEETVMSNYWPTSLMYPYNFGYPDGMEAYYMNELFNTDVAPYAKLSSNDETCVHDVEVK